MAVIKPDAAASADAILAEAAAEGFLTVAKKTTTLSKEQAAQLVAGGADAAAQAEHLCSGEVTVVALEKSFGIESWLQLLGPEDAALARETAPRSLRARYGSDAVKNAVHGSTSVAAAAKEAAFFFGDATTKPETTFAFVKPDAFANADAIIAIAESAGFSILCSEQVPSPHVASRHAPLACPTRRKQAGPEAADRPAWLAYDGRCVSPRTRRRSSTRSTKGATSSGRCASSCRRATRLRWC